MMENLDHTPAGFGRSEMSKLEGSAEEVLIFPPLGKAMLATREGGMSCQLILATVLVNCVACETTSSLLEWTAATPTC